MTKARISELKDMTIRTSEGEQEREQSLEKTKQTPQELWDNDSRYNRHVTKISGGERREMKRRKEYSKEFP